MRSGFFNNKTVWADDFAKFAGGILTNGILADEVSVLEVSPSAGMTVSVAQGYCWIDGYFGYAETAETLTIASSDGTYGRIDRVVARLNLSNKEITLAVITGELAAEPVAPDIVRDGTIYDLGLATVSVPAGTLEITASLITDTRRNTSVCGGVYPRLSSEFVWENANNVGDIKMTACAVAPEKWLICDGSAVSRTTYADLFAAIGTTYGAGNGSTTFNLPNLKGRTVFGKDDDSFDTLGGTGGAKTHTLTSNEMPSHTHTASSSLTIDTTSTDGNPEVQNDKIRAGTHKSGSLILTPTVSLGNTGGGVAFSILPPFITLNYVIFTGVAS